MGPGAKDEVMMASEDAAMNAQLNPWTARAMTSISELWARPPASEVSPNRASAATNTRRCPSWSAARPPSIRNPANEMA